MLKTSLLSVCFLVLSLCSYSQKDYKVVFDLTSKDSTDQAAVIRWLNEITSTNPEAQLEVVMYGRGLNMVVQGKSFVSNEVQRIAGNKNVGFRVCAIAMKNQGIDKSQLLPGVGIVPDGIYEIVSKQKQGWGYIKAAH
jgi:hypothetical protein